MKLREARQLLLRMAEAASVSQARQLLPKLRFDAVVCDLALPDGDGLDVLRDCRELDSTVQVIMLTAGRHDSWTRVGEAMRGGAYDYLQKPVTQERLNLVLGRAMERRPVPSCSSPT